MIKIFCTDDDKPTINGWRETNAISSIEFGTVEEGKILNLNDFPAIANINGGSIRKVYAQGMDNFMNITLEEISEIKSNM